MRRKDFIKIIKLRSDWRIDHRRGDYELPNGEKLSKYVQRLVESQLELDALAINKDGDLCVYSGGTWSKEKKEFLPYRMSNNEICSFDEMEYREKRLVREIVYG